jgi:hypothetical protein
MPSDVTTWLIVGIPERPRISVLLVVGTTAPAVVERIEFAAAEAGIELERVAASDG